MYKIRIWKACVGPWKGMWHGTCNCEKPAALSYWAWGATYGAMYQHWRDVHS